MTLEQILPQLHQAQKLGKKIVLVTGVFDVLHSEHIKFLHQAKLAGELLIVGIESDVRVKHLKGPGRPVNNQGSRWRNVAEITDVDLAFVLPEKFSQPSDHEALIATIRPAVLAVSSHTNHVDKKQRILAKYGGEVKIVHQHNPEISTTKILEMLSA